MKQKFLLLGAMLLMSISASAQNFTATWEKPAAPEFGTYAPETEFYLWNVGAGGFYTCWQGGDGSPYWGTRASVNDTIGNLVKFTRFNPSGTDETDAFDWCDANGYPNVYLLTSYVNTRGFNRFMCTFAGNYNDIWCDNDGRQDRYWNVIQNGSYIKIEGGPKNVMFTADQQLAETDEAPLYDYAGKYLGARENSDDPVLFLYDTAEGRIGADEAFYSDWAVVTAEAYEAYMTASKNIMKAIAAAQALRAAIEKAYADYPGINLDAQIAVYNNTSSTVEEIQHAQAAVAFRVAIEKALTDYPGLELPEQMAVYNDPASTDADYKASEAAMTPIILAFAAQNATPENPVNFSASIVNATFDTIGDFHGWSGTSFGAGGTTSTSAEHYGHNFDSYQDIDLTGYPGVYAVKVKGYVREKNAQNAWDIFEAGETDSPGSLYISSASFGEMSTPIKNICVAALDADPGSNNSSAVTDSYGNTHYIPNTMLAATTSYFTLDPCPYQVTALNAVVDGEKLRIGVRNQSMSGSCWANFDDFELWYYGNSAAAYTAIKENLLASIKLEIAEGAHYGQPDLDAYNAAVEQLKAAGSAEEIAAAVKAVSTAKENIQKSIDAYAKYIAQVNAAEEWLVNSNAVGEMADKLADYVQTPAVDNDEMADYGFPNGVVNYIIDLEHGAVAGRLTAEEIEAETTYLSALLQEAIRTSMTEDQEVTYLLTNPSFDTGDFTGWTYKAGKLGNHNVECYQSVVDVYQIVENVPAGIYEISVQAFERPGGNGSFNGTEEPRVFLFMNDFQTPVQNICADGISNENAVDKVNCLIGDGGGGWPNDYYVNDEIGWIPNSVDGAYYAFSAGRYEQSCYGLVGDDGIMKIGLTSNNKTIEWVLWANFRLFYKGKNITAMKSIINDFAERALNIDGVYGAPEMAALETARTAALQEVAKQNPNADDMYAALEALVKAFNAAQTGVTLYAEVEKLCEEYSSKMYDDPDFQVVGDGDAITAAMDYFDTVFNMITVNQTMNNEDVQKAIDKMAQLYADAIVPSEINYASPENPVNLSKLIVNGTFDTIGDFTGWSDGFGAGGTTGPSAECWMKTFDVYQDVTVPRTGTYEATVNGAYRSGWAESDYKDWKNNEQNNCFFYAQTTTAQVSCLVPHNCAGGRPDSDWATKNANPNDEANPWYIADSMAEFDLYFHEQTDEDGNPIEPYRIKNVINVTDEDELVIRIGVKKDVVNDGDWAIFDDFELYYLGKDGLPNGPNPMDPDAVEGVSNAKATVVGIYTVGGARVATLQRGINIVRMSDGSVRKFIVK